METVISTFFYKSYNGNERKQEFKCLDCGCTECYREKYQAHYSFLEGSFFCKYCNKEIVYYDDDFTGSDVIPPQLKLEFDL